MSTDFSKYMVTVGRGKDARVLLITGTDFNNAAFLAATAEGAPITAISSIVRVKNKRLQARAGDELIKARLAELSAEIERGKR